VSEFSRPTVAIYNGDGLLRDEWVTTELANNDVLVFVTLPLGGDGGSDPLRMMLMLAIVLTAQYYLTPELMMSTFGLAKSQVALASALSTTAIAAAAIGGAVLVNALLPMETPDTPSLPSPTYTIGARNNRARPREVIPVLYGRHLIVPDYGEQPYTEWTGQQVLHLDANGDPFIPSQGPDFGGGFTATQVLYQVFCLGQGEMDVEQIRVGEVDITTFADVSSEVIPPGGQVTLVPSAVEVSPDVKGLRLAGVGDRKTNPEFAHTRGVDDVQVGQILPEQWTKFYAATDGGSYTADENETNPLLTAGVTYGFVELEDTAGPGTPPEWTENEHIGKVVYIGGPTPEVNGAGHMGVYGLRTGTNNVGLLYPGKGWTAGDAWNSDGTKKRDWTDPVKAAPAEKLVHPDRVKTIYANSADTLYVRPNWSENFVPHINAGTSRRFHIRDDWVGPFVANSPESVASRLTLDFEGPPLYHFYDGEHERLPLGLRLERRLIDDSGIPDAGSEGEWQGLGDDVKVKQTIYGGRPGPGTDNQIYVEDTSYFRGKYRPQWRALHRCNLMLFGTGFKLNPVAISVSYDVPPGRYEVRVRRTTIKSTHEDYSNEIKWGGLKAHLSDAERVFPDVTMLAMRIQASGELNSRNFASISVVATRKLPIYNGEGFSDTALPDDPITVTAGSTRVAVAHPAHGLSTGAEVTFAGLEATAGISANNLNGLTDMGTNPVGTLSGSTTVTITQTAHGLSTDALVTLAGLTATGGVPATDLNLRHSITVIDADSYSIEVATTATSSASGGGGSGTSTNTRATIVVDPGTYTVEVPAAATSNALTFTHHNLPRTGAVYAVDDTIYLCTTILKHTFPDQGSVVQDESGFYISTDHGANWALSDLETTEGLGGRCNSILAIDTGSAHTLYIGTSDINTNLASYPEEGGLSISTDGGATFTTKTSAANGLASDDVGKVYVVDGTIYCATSGGLSVSTDGGDNFSSWTTSDGLLHNVATGFFVRDNNGTHEIFMGNGFGLSYSLDGGDNWINRTQADFLPAPPGNLGAAVVGSVFVYSDRIYCGTLAGLSISQAPGGTFSMGEFFTTRTSAANGLASDHVNQVWVEGGTIYAATGRPIGVYDYGTEEAPLPPGGLAISTDGGDTFINKRIEHGFQTDHVNGVFVTDNNGVHTVYAHTGADPSPFDLQGRETGGLAISSGIAVGPGGGTNATVSSAGGFTKPQVTRSPAWALADMMRSSKYSIGLADSKIDLTGLTALAIGWAKSGDEFNAVFDGESPLLLAASRVARAGRARVFLPDGKVTVIRDQPQYVRTAMFSSRNMVRGTISTTYRFDTAETPDSVTVEYFDSATWKPRSVDCYLYDGGSYTEGSAKPQDLQNATRRLIRGNASTNWQSGTGAGDALIGSRFQFDDYPALPLTITAVKGETTLVVDPPVPPTILTGFRAYTITKAGSRSKPARIKLFGVTNRNQAWREGMYSVADAKYRRRGTSFETDYEGHLCRVGDQVAVTMDILGLFQQTGDVDGYLEAVGVAPVLTTSEPLLWEERSDVLPNGTFETDTAGWTFGGTNNLGTRITSDAQTGTACLQSAKGNAGADTWLSVHNVISGVVGYSKDSVFAASAWVKAGNATAEGATCSLQLRENGGGSSYENTSVDMVLTSDWQEVSAVHRIIRSDRESAQLVFVISGAAGMTLLIDNVKLWGGPFVIAVKDDHGGVIGPTVCYPIIDYNEDGSAGSPFRSGPIIADQMALSSALGFSPTTEAGARDKTQYLFGTTSQWTTDSRVTSIVPRGENRVLVHTVNEDARVHTASDETYIATQDDPGTPQTPTAPAKVEGLTVLLRGNRNDMVVSASWHPATGAEGYEAQQGILTDEQTILVQGGEISNGSLAVDEGLTAFGPVRSALALFNAANSLTKISVVSGDIATGMTAHGMTTGGGVWIVAAGAFSGIPASEINGYHTITNDGEFDFSFTVATSGNTIDSGTNAAAGFTWYPPSGATGVVSTAASNGDANVRYAPVAGEFAFGDLIRGDTNGATFYNDSYEGSENLQEWVTLGWTTSNSIEGPFVGSGQPGDDKLAYVRVRGQGGLWGEWATASATIPADTETHALVFNATTGQPQAGSTAAQILYSISGWVTYQDDVGVSPSTVSTVKTIGELPTNHVVQSVEVRLVEAFNATGTNTLAWGYHEGDAGAWSNGYGFTKGERVTNPVSLPTDPVSTTSGSATVTINQPGHGLDDGGEVTLAGLSDTGGAFEIDLNGTHTITQVDTDNYTFTMPATATSTTTGGGSGGTEEALSTKWRAISAHTSAAATEPEVGVSWADVWVAEPTDDYAAISAESTTTNLTRGVAVGEMSALARTVVATYHRTLVKPSAGAALVTLHYYVVPSNPVSVAAPSLRVHVAGAEPRYAKLPTTGFNGSTTIFNDRLPSIPRAADEVLILHMNAALVQVASSPTIGQFSLSGTGTSLNRNIEFGRAPESGDTVYALYLDS
jgi:hypothetical protein